MHSTGENAQTNKQKNKETNKQAPKRSVKDLKLVQGLSPTWLQGYHPERRRVVEGGGAVVRGSPGCSQVCHFKAWWVVINLLAAGLLGHIISHMKSIVSHSSQLSPGDQAVQAYLEGVPPVPVHGHCQSLTVMNLIGGHAGLVLPREVLTLLHSKPLLCLQHYGGHTSMGHMCCSCASLGKSVQLRHLFCCAV